MLVGKAARRTKALKLFGTSGVNQASISEKDYVLNRGGLTDTANSFFFTKVVE